MGKGWSSLSILYHLAYPIRHPFTVTMSSLTTRSHRSPSDASYYCRLAENEYYQMHGSVIVTSYVKVHDHDSSAPFQPMYHIFLFSTKQNIILFFYYGINFEFIFF